MDDIAEEYDYIIVGGGTAHLLPHRPRWAPIAYLYLEDLYVKGEHCRRGIGKSLLYAALVEAVELGLTRLLQTTQTDNPARSLFDRFGSAADVVQYRVQMLLTSMR